MLPRGTPDVFRQTVHAKADVDVVQLVGQDVISETATEFHDSIVGHGSGNQYFHLVHCPLNGNWAAGSAAVFAGYGPQEFDLITRLQPVKCRLAGIDLPAQTSLETAIAHSEYHRCRSWAAASARPLLFPADCTGRLSR